MSKDLSKVYNMSLKQIFRSTKGKLRGPKAASGEGLGATGEVEQLRQIFSVYKTKNLKSVSPEDFARHIRSRIGTVDGRSEGYTDEEMGRQRDLSVKFHWGHDHDFGGFKIKGRMGERHIELMANFISLFPVSIDDFKGKAVLDVGCWTGGTTLLLAALAQKVIALEEVRKYAQMAEYLSKSFGIDDRVSVRPSSVYACNTEEFANRFDIAYFPGVIYHVTDPLLALRILFNALKVGGLILIESAGIDRDEAYLEFEGSRIHHDGSQEELNRGGWNWFLPSPTALQRMMTEAGFEEIQCRWHEAAGRVYGFGRKLTGKGVCKAGFSVPDIK